MRIVIAIALALTVSVIAPRDAHGQLVHGSFVTTDDVLEMFAKLPACEGCSRSSRGHFERSRDARDIAASIAMVVDGSLLGDVDKEAAVMATYAAFESNVTRCAHGDRNPRNGKYRAWGPWQLWNEPVWVACDPVLAARVWYARAKKVSGICARNDLASRLAPMASGRCEIAREKVRKRFAVAMSVAG